MGPWIALTFGAVVGSFCNVCIYRLPRRESIISPPS
ncbi:prepilin peptidase, partial [Gemmatimonadota bacterium]